MGLAATPRHRAEVSRTQAFAALRRRAAHLVVGRDLYADDQVLRGGTPALSRPLADDTPATPTPAGPVGPVTQRRPATA